MKIVQWNTHHGGIGTDDKFDPTRIGTFLKTLSPDVVCLNEVEQFDGHGNTDCVQAYCDALGLGWKGVFTNLSGIVGGKGQGNCILSAMPISGVSSKVLVNARVALRATVGNTIVISTHLDNVSAYVREVQNYQINYWMHELKRMVICADWNCLPDSVELSVNRQWYKDAWTESKKLGTATAFNGTGNTRTHRIDMIFAMGINVKSCDVPDSRVDGVFPSDHNPVVAIY